jgi:hypothetical protein
MMKWLKQSLSLPCRVPFFEWAGGKGFQRPFELATLRLRNMGEVLGHWGTYVPDAAYLTQRGGTFLFNRDGDLLYEHRDLNILGFAENMSRPLSFLDSLRSAPVSTSGTCLSFTDELQRPGQANDLSQLKNGSTALDKVVLDTAPRAAPFFRRS